MKVFDENIPAFFSIMDFNGVQKTVSVQLQGFKRFQTINKGLIK